MTADATRCGDEDGSATAASDARQQRGRGAQRHADKCGVVGGGILGVAVAERLTRVCPDSEVVLFEKEDRLAAHQTGRNSGVVHAGLYYLPGSLKARLCRRGVGMLREFCTEHSVPYIECGKVLVALDRDEERRLDDIEQRARANGVPGIRRLDAAELHDLEPHVDGVAGLHSPTTAIADFVGTTEALAKELTSAAGRLELGATVVGLGQELGRGTIRYRRDAQEVQESGFDLVICCAGLQSDRIGELVGDSADPMIVPFRGEYYQLRPDRRSLINGLIYPVPDPHYPFLGVHLTPRFDGEVLVGPNAVLALAREGYRWSDVSWGQVAQFARSEGFRAFAREHWRTATREMMGSLVKQVFAASARRYVPDLQAADLLPGRSGVRAQALSDDGTLVDDFRISVVGPFVVVRNAPSPGATSALAMAEYIVDGALRSAS